MFTQGIARYIAMPPPRKIIIIAITFKNHIIVLNHETGIICLKSTFMEDIRIDCQNCKELFIQVQQVVFPYEQLWETHAIYY